jgi:hypothetical protein
VTQICVTWVSMNRRRRVAYHRQVLIVPAGRSMTSSRVLEQLWEKLKPTPFQSTFTIWSVEDPLKGFQVRRSFPKTFRKKQRFLLKYEHVATVYPRREAE